ncbi:hypothetical protein [Celerinatantimonas sp. MCCC 1A17872]|uniref:hypothetical protein n=1 Tax=Celerinatantimonas sp. MCCC 1A17872 TaxID=3177514 RepID=UPI0038CB7663
MTLASEAKELAETLQAIVEGLEGYDLDSRREYSSKMADRLKPLVNSFRELVLVEKSRDSAKLQLDGIKELMHNVNGAATKGEINFVSGSTLNRYWELSTIFQETKYVHESL